MLNGEKLAQYSGAYNEYLEGHHILSWHSFHIIYLNSLEFYETILKNLLIVHLYLYYLIVLIRNHSIELLRKLVDS